MTTKKKFEALGLNPPGDGHDLERTYHETVRNLDAEGRASEIPEGDLEKAQAYFAGFGEPENDDVTVGVE